MEKNTENEPELRHFWAAVKELQLSYYIGETPLFTIYIYIYVYTHYGK